MSFDLDAYVRRSVDGPCFVCAFLDGHPDYRHHLVFADDESVVFLSRYPTLPGYCLVAPRRHLESWVTDMSPDEYLRFQALVHRVGRALQAVLPVERMYALSLGSRQGNAHLHWHVVPLPPGVPYAEQQFHAVMLEGRGLLDVSEASQAALAAEIAARL
jgi:diadenosine tetraphosphate (Ap4A) HIT family hydrolase